VNQNLYEQHLDVFATTSFANLLLNEAVSKGNAV
jgi:hypothetical protein